MEEDNNTTDSGSASSNDNQPQRVSVHRVNNEQSEPPKADIPGFRIRTGPATNPLGCIWLILVAVVGLLAMGCAGLVAIVIAFVASISKFITETLKKLLNQG